MRPTEQEARPRNCPNSVADFPSMGYRELLPRGEAVANQLKEAGLTPEQQQAAFESIAHLLDEYADYYQNEYERVGEKEDRGAQEAIAELAEMFRSEGRYSTAVD